MKRVMTGIALTAIGLAAAATFATAANAASGTATFTNWGECDYYGQLGVIQGHHITSYQCHDNGSYIPGGPHAYMTFTY